MDIFVIIPLAVLLAGVLLQLLLRNAMSSTLKGWIGLICGLIATASIIALIPTINAGNPIDINLFNWDRGISIQYHVDGLSLVFGLLSTGIGTAILVYCVQYMAHEPEGTTRFYALMLTFIAGFINLVFSANLLMVYFSWEIIGLCSYFLVGFWYKNSKATDGARKVLIMTHLPGYGLLIAILLLNQKSGTFIWTDPSIAASFTTGIFLLMLVSAMAKSVMFPLHTWIPEAMNAPTPVSALLHSACYVKAGVYIIARIYSLTSWQPAWNELLLAIGCFTMVIGALYALLQTDLKRLLAFSTISQLGYIITAFGLGTNLGIAAGIFYTLSHGLFKGTLFLGAGAIQHATGTRDMRELGGLSRLMPKTTRIWMVVAAAIVGVPLTNGFVAKWMLYDAALESGQWLVVFIAWLVSTFTMFYMLKATTTIFFGELPDGLVGKDIEESPIMMRTGMGVLAGLALVFGIAPQILLNSVVFPAVRDLGFDWSITTSWMGLQTSSADIPVSMGAGITILAILLGWVIYKLLTPTQNNLANVFSGGDPLPSGDMVGTVDFSEFAEESILPGLEKINPDRIYMKIWQGIQNIARQLNKLASFEENHALISSIIMAIVVLAVIVIF